MNKTKVSVIILAHNLENIERCIDSIFLQTIDDDYYEIILMTETLDKASVNWIKKYCDKKKNKELPYRKSVSEVSSLGTAVQKANGHYLAFVDSDDYISHDTLQNIVHFFDGHFGDIDIVTYSICSGKGFDAKYENIRKKIFSETGIYDTEKYPFICQSTSNVFVKKKSVLKCLTSVFTVSIEQDFITRIIMDKKKIGYVESAKYYIGKENLPSPFVFIDEIKCFEKLFNDYRGCRYIHALFLYNMEKRIVSDRLYPYHLEGECYNQVISEMVGVLAEIDPLLILEHPAFDYYHRFFVLKLAGTNLTVLPEKMNMCIYLRDILVHRRSKIEIVVSKLTVRDGHLVIEAFLKDPVFLFIEEPKLFAIINGRTVKIPLFRSDAGRYLSKMMTNIFYGFEIYENIENIREIYFEIDISGVLYKTSFYFMWFSRIAPAVGRYSFEDEGHKVVFGFDDKFHVSPTNMTKKKTVWLYYDCMGVDYDNGLLQFLHDVSENDGVKRYYVLNKNQKIDAKIYEEYRKKIVKFGSSKHIQLLKEADKILTAYIEHKTIFPFDYDRHQALADDITAEIIYLQHGVLHGSMPWKYSPEIVYFDRLVISSYFEKDNYHVKYHVPERKIIKSGMPRFEIMKRDSIPDKETRRILFAPTWRSYLIEEEGEGWNREGTIFKSSNYYKGFMNFLTDSILIDFLHDNNIKLDFKLHPVFACYKNFFDDVKNDNINVITSSVYREDVYSVFITDFSSMVFDYAWIKRPIVYYIPDMYEFKAGLNSYRELDLSFEKAFGKIVTTPSSLLKEIKKIVSKGYNVESKYKLRMDDFFLPMEKCTEDIYKTLR